MLSQFTREAGHDVLSDVFDFPKDVYPIGRLDHDSEGLLILTNDKSLNKMLLDPESRKQKIYSALVEGRPNNESIGILQRGITLNLKGVKHQTLPAQVSVLENFSPEERIPPVNYTKHDTHTWMEIRITEGKNRQVRRMFAAVGFPVLRLIRTGFEQLTIDDLEPGEVREYERTTFYELLNISTKGFIKHR